MHDRLFHWLSAYTGTSIKKSGGVKLVVEIRQLFPIKRTILQVITKTHIVKEKICNITERRE